jgi:outer membrane protein TolC
MMLEHDPNLAIGEAGLRASRGLLLSTRGDFDPVLSTSMSEAETETPVSESASEQSGVLTNSFGLRKRFRTGLSIEPGLNLQRQRSPGDAEAGAVNLGTASFTFRQPLLRGRGRDVTAAPELSAEREVAASALDLEQTTAERTFAVVSQYWVARAEVDNLEILRANEESARALLETTRKLIESDVTPAAELVQVEANLVAAETARIGGERALFEAQRDLGREIGLEPSQIASLPFPADPFPVVAPSAVPSASGAQGFVAAALERRADLQAARERRESAEILLRAADDGLQPQLDLVWTPSYTGLVQGDQADAFLSPLYRNVPGASSLVSVSLSWPTLNRRAQGDRARFAAAREQSALFVDLVSRQIGADVPTALDAVARHAQQLERAAEAVRLYERAVVNEERKLRAGTSTLLDMINQRDRLIAARQARVSAHLALALALVRLRFETGTLVPDGDTDPDLYVMATSLPPAAPAAGKETPP